MNKLHFSIEIQAPVQKVWDTMLSDATYREWTVDFNPAGGSYFEGDWSEGSKMLFLGSDAEGNLGGMIGKVAKNTPDQNVSIEYYGEILNGVEDTISDRVKSWSGAHENYSFTEKDGVTHLEIELDANDEMKQMFEDVWPKALERLKKLAEKQ